MTKKTAVLSFENQSIDLPIYSPTLGFDVIDVKALGKQQHFTFDPGYFATASCESKITYIDGDAGILLYRGYPIDQLAARCDYIDTCYLLIYGELPTASEKKDFNSKLQTAGTACDLTHNLFSGFSKEAHPMGILLSVMGALSTRQGNACDLKKPEDRENAVIRLIAKVPVIAAMAYRHNQGLPFIAPDKNLGYVENFLHMLFGDENKTHNKTLVTALDRIFILHADHEQNASTSTVRMAGSTGTHPFAAITAGISALWGAAHGGANEACLKMLNTIGDESHIEKYIEKAKDKNDPFRLMGFGHRVYKSYDPRAKVMQKTCHDVLEAMQAKNAPLFKLAVKLEKIALEDPYFIERKLYPNVDFYSGITLSAMHIPSNLFTVIFALARTVGWASHWFEMMNDADHPLYRPRQLYTGSDQRNLS
ncbi:MAG: citrate (Si)-synthase [Gammaproteobacteria bacterium CG_4_10_14_0_8_um_filter_38_16]|nr:MAG: citrate (Si)-synthase [Gammaproteobacteria bacterium CG_4_10_14_0_8_um_filter_38_16]PJA02975.1 MAG: citrate (Si)-synthase [Gammaproteobacteria bacterium CG_4_10_14_0_2_um_filter_38_22]PJB09441.1 MAG: citrate (Si)-synthase [Gammaproteobacteria bacterium CG_4_9_14_3_um_filter_38_9]